MVRGVEVEDLVDRNVDVFGDAVQVEVVGCDQLLFDEGVDETLPTAPVSRPRSLEHRDRVDIGLPGLDQRQQLEGLILGPEAAGKEDERVRFLDEGQLAGEEVLVVDQTALVHVWVGV